jgi:cytochrome c oxidase assembly protein subunit 15
MLAPPKSPAEVGVPTGPRPDLLIRWLYAVAALIVTMVIVGGITRLTESGLSITEWRPVTGALPPLNAADWQREFDLYRQTTEYQTVNRGMSMADFQFIYFWEWFHRFLARLVGLAFAAPLAFFAWKRMIPVGFGWRLVGLLALGGLQGVVGWWMVASGLVGRTDVSHYRLAVHLNLALLILGLVIWTARDLAQLVRDPLARPRQLTRSGLIVLAIFAVQLVWGAFVAGLNAGYAFSSWPLMGEEFFPANTVWSAPWLSNLVDNPIVVQFIHRWWAFVAVAALIWLGLKAIRSGGRRPGAMLHALVVVQVLLGIATLLSGMALWVAVAHQGVAALLVIAAAMCAHVIAMPASRAETAVAGRVAGLATAE